MRIYSEMDFGLYNAMNRGIVRASGDYIMFMNAGDSFWNNHVLSDIEKQISKYGNGLYYGQAYLMRKEKIRGIDDLLKHNKSEYSALMKGHMPVHQSIASLAYLLKRYYFNEEYSIRADYDWLLKCYKEKVNFINLGFPVCKYDCSGISERAKHNGLLQKETQIIRRKNSPIRSRIYKIFDKWQ